MSPTYTMSAHLCKEIYKSFQNRRTSPEPTTTSTILPPVGFLRRSPSPEKRSMDSDRSDSVSSASSTSSQPMTRSASAGSWTWGRR
ncbi:hypothetical protein F5Y16DRAFT_357057 [Xylariaceae sp. FL0255]|nr:hypothetical protein F5Y16DRAFT_357057 [Xylariaceae sp. FL0255]